MAQFACIAFGIIFIVKGAKGFRETGIMFGFTKARWLTGNAGRRAGMFMIAVGIALIAFGLIGLPMLKANL